MPTGATILGSYFIFMTIKLISLSNNHLSTTTTNLGSLKWTLWTWMNFIFICYVRFLRTIFHFITLFSNQSKKRKNTLLFLLLVWFATVHLSKNFFFLKKRAGSVPGLENELKLEQTRFRTMKFWRKYVKFSWAQSGPE